MRSKVYGFHSGMSRDEVRLVLRTRSADIVENKHFITASNFPDRGRFEVMVFGFCEDKLVNLQNHLKPTFDTFVRELREKQAALGRPRDIMSHSTGYADSKSDSITVIWKATDRVDTISYTKFLTNDQVHITIDEASKCFQLPY